MRARWMWMPVLPVLTACHQFPPGVCRAGDDSTVEIRIAFDDRSNAPLPMAAGQRLSGTLAAPGTLRVDAIAVQIGNDNGVADGQLELRLCQAGRCVKSQSDVTAVKGNDYLTFTLNPSLPVTYAAGPIDYELRRISGRNTISIWSYPSVTTQAALEIDGKQQPQTLNVLLRQQ